VCVGGGNLFFYHIKEAVCGPLRRGDYIKEVGDENMYSSKTEAIADIFQTLDKDICANCDKQIFNECQSIEQVKTKA